MKLWILNRTDPVGWDEYDAFVVRAEDEAQARKIAYDESNPSTFCNPWSFDQTLVECRELVVDGEAGVILGSFNAG